MRICFNRRPGLGCPSLALCILGLLPYAYAFQAPLEVKDAKQELFAARYGRAAELYSKRLTEAPQDGEAYYGLVRALLEAHRSQEAYVIAEKAGEIAPSAATLTAIGLGAYRHGDLGKAEEDFRAALKLDPQFPGALAGLASIYSSVSKFKTARDLRLAAYHRSPTDPDLMLAYANSLKGEEHITQLQRIVDSIDPDAELAQRLRAHIANDRAVGDRKLRRLTSPYEESRVKMFHVMNGLNHPRGFGVHVRLNGKQSIRLLLDTGASGISISPKAAERAGIEKLGEVASEAKGIGDEKAQTSFSFIVSELRAGDVTFADYPVSVFRSAQSPDYDGLMGADVFRQFVVGLDFPNLEIVLSPRPGGLPIEDEVVDASNSPAPGFQRVLRFGDHLVLTTTMNEKKTGLMLVDSGSTVNLIDAAVAKEASSVREDSLTTLKGVQGKVEKLSRADRISLVFAGFRQDNPDLIAFDMTKLGDSSGVRLSGILGMPVLAALKVSIDYAEGALKLEYRK